MTKNRKAGYAIASNYFLSTSKHETDPSFRHTKKCITIKIIVFWHKTKACYSLKNNMKLI